MGLNIGIIVKKQLVSHDRIDDYYLPQGTLDELNKQFEEFIHQRLSGIRITPYVSCDEDEETYEFDVRLYHEDFMEKEGTFYATIFEFVITKFDFGQSPQITTYFLP